MNENKIEADLKEKDITFIINVKKTFTEGLSFWLLCICSLKGWICLIWTNQHHRKRSCIEDEEEEGWEESKGRWECERLQKKPTAAYPNFILGLGCDFHMISSLLLALCVLEWFHGIPKGVLPSKRSLLLIWSFYVGPSERSWRATKAFWNESWREVLLLKENANTVIHFPNSFALEYFYRPWTLKYSKKQA